MADARKVFDRMTAAVVRGDVEGAAGCYADDAVLATPEGAFKGRDQIAGYFRTWAGPFTDVSFEFGAQESWGNRALDEWTLSATNSGAIEMPTGETVPATGKRVTVRGADIATVDGDHIVKHNIYYDQLEVLGQLGLLPD